MKAKQLVKDLKDAFPDYQFQLDRAGAGWFRIFVKSERSYESERLWVTLGRVSVDPNGPLWLKHYKPRDYPFEMEDRFFYLFWAWEQTRQVPQVDFLAVVGKAKLKKRMRIEDIEEWRKQNPHPQGKRRRKIDRNWMGMFRDLVSEEIAAEVGEGSHVR